MLNMIERGDNIDFTQNGVVCGEFVTENRDKCDIFSRYIAAAMGGVMYETMMKWLMEEKWRLEGKE